MVKVISYNIRFPFGANFQKDIEILFLKKIYSQILKCTCIESEKCKECIKKSKCIYYLLSGNDFETYPSIGVKRNLVNKRRFASNDVLKLSFFLVGIAVNYSEFITAFLEEDEYICSYFYQKVLIENRIYDENNSYTGIIKFNNVVKDVDDIINSINYYNQKYKCDYQIPNIDEFIEEVNFQDNTKYTINSCKIDIKGKLLKVKINNFPTQLMEFGVGKYAFLGGGTAQCDSKL